MILEATRGTVLRIVEDSLGADVEHLEFSSLLSRVTPTEGEATIDRVHSMISTSMLEALLGHHENDAGSVMKRSPAVDLCQLH